MSKPNGAAEALGLVVAVASANDDDVDLAACPKGDGADHDWADEEWVDETECLRCGVRTRQVPDHACEDYAVERASGTGSTGSFDVWKQCAACGRTWDRDQDSVL